MLIHKSRDLLKAKFGNDPDLLVQAPGRINVMGEHTDYNDGFVLPAAIDHYMYMAFVKNGTDKVNVYAIDLDETTTFDLRDIKPGKSDWKNLVMGVVFQMKDQIAGFDLAFCGDIPSGAGLSSSAALCCGTSFGLSTLFDLGIKKWDLAKIAQKSEHDFLEVKCGIMDQFASVFGLTNHVLILDCLNLKYEESEVDITGYKFLLLDSNVTHQLNDSAYNDRRQESASALSKIKIVNPQVKSYQDVTLEMVEKNPMDEVLKKRARHIVTENQRVLAVSKALKSHKMETLGALLSEGHQSLKDNYEVTCEETNFLQEILTEELHVLGGRQVGGGFGGCILSIVKDQDIDSLVSRVNVKYKKRFGQEATKIPIRISKGCHVVDDII